jgi:ATP-dependent helicase/nuclease subunit A
MQVKLDRPKFLQEFKLTPTERGTAYHTVMQHMPFEMGGLQIPSFMDNLVSQQLLTEAQRQGVDAEHLQTFVKSPLYTQLAQADAVYRELPFSLGIPAGELHPELSGDSATKPILMQGVIDCLFEIDGNLHLLDYKTDRVTTTPADIGERYRKQLELYARAIEQMTGRKVAQRILYLFDGGHTITV